MTYKLFIDESGVNFKELDNIWVHCALFGTEEEINEKYNKVCEEFCAKLPKYKKIKELRYSEIYGKDRETIIDILCKYNFDFTIIYCNAETQHYCGGG